MRTLQIRRECGDNGETALETVRFPNEADGDAMFPVMHEGRWQIHDWAWDEGGVKNIIDPFEIDPEIPAGTVLSEEDVARLCVEEMESTYDIEYE